MDCCPACAKTGEVTALSVSYCTACGRVESAGVAYQTWGATSLALVLAVAAIAAMFRRRIARRTVAV